MTIHQGIRQEIEAARTSFQELLASIPDEAFSLPSDNPAWTIGEVLYHMSLAPRFLSQDVKMITTQSWMYKIIPIIISKQFFDWLNKKMTKYGARKISRDFLAAEYDKAHQVTIKALGEVKEADFKKKLNYPDWDPLLSGEVTLERLFRYVKVHFDEHAAEIRRRILVD